MEIYDSRREETVAELNIDQQKAMAMASARKRMAEAGSPPPEQNNKNNEEFGSVSSLYKTLTGTPHEIKPLTAGNIGQAARKAAIKATQQVAPMVALEGATKALSPVFKPIMDKMSQTKAVQKMMSNRPSLQEEVKPAGDITSKNLKAYSGTQYNKIPQGTTRYKPEYMEAVRKDLFPKSPKTRAEKIAYAEDPVVRFMSKYTPVFKDQVSVNDFEIMDQDLTQHINANFKNGLSSDGQKLYDLQTKLRDKMLDPANDAIMGGVEDVKTYRRALKSYSDAKRLEDIENIFRTSTTAQDKASSLRNGFKRLYNSPKRLRGYNEKQIKLIKQASESDMTLQQIKDFGNKFVSKIAIATGHPIAGVTSSVLSNAIRSTDEAIAAKKAQPLINSIIDPYKNPMSNLTKGLGNAKE